MILHLAGSVPLIMFLNAMGLFSARFVAIDRSTALVMALSSAPDNLIEGKVLSLHESQHLRTEVQQNSTRHKRKVVDRICRTQR